MIAFAVSIGTDNAAFADDFEGEVARLLVLAAERAAEALGEQRAASEGGRLLDANGNTVGSWTLIATA